MLAEGPSNGSMMDWQMTLFGTASSGKGRFFKGLPSADDDAGYYAVVEALWTLDYIHCVCNQYFFFYKARGGGRVGLGNLEKLTDRKKTIAIYRRLLSKVH